MSLFLVAYIGGVLTILSPCILPILPFAFTRSGRPFLSSTVPMLAGLAIAFSTVATLAAIGGGWAVQVNQIGRSAALVCFALVGMTLLSSRIASTLTAPLVSVGNQLVDRQDPRAGSTWHSLMLGAATGLLWAPCAGPILGLVLTGAAWNGANARTSLLLLAYASGAATSIAGALLLGRPALAALKKTFGAAAWLKRALGICVLASVGAISLGFDTGALAQLSFSSTSVLEQSVIDRFKPATVNSAETNGTRTSVAAAQPSAEFKSNLPLEGTLPSLDGAVQWLNSAPLTREALRGKVVLVDFWTYSCINCIRTLPYVRAWADKYRDQGLVVVGVHSPEFAFEKDIDNIKAAIDRFGIHYPVAVDSDFRIWRAFDNNYWPALYFVDANGRIRHHQFGEGDYAKSEAVIQDLLAEAAGEKRATEHAETTSKDAELAPDLKHLGSPETYLGYKQATNFASPETMAADVARLYSAGRPGLNEWGLQGRWTIGAESAVLNDPDGAIIYRFTARDLHLVLGPGHKGGLIRFQVTIDGKPPGSSHGADTDADGRGTIDETRLYQLVRQSGDVGEHSFAIRFLDPGVHAFVFTFG